MDEYLEILLIIRKLYDNMKKRFPKILIAIERAHINLVYH